MNGKWVIDASVGLAWVLPAQAGEATDKLLRQLKQGITLVVPSLWFQEVANALLVLQRRKRLSAADRQEALAALASFNTEADSGDALRVFGKISNLAELHQLSVYDATYLELAMRERLPLATRDDSLRSAAKACGVEFLLK